MELFYITAGFNNRDTDIESSDLYGFCAWKLHQTLAVIFSSLFWRAIDGKRLGLKMVLPEEYDLEDQIYILNEKIKEKYEGECVL